MLVIYPVGPNDADLALRTIAQAVALGPCSQHDLVVLNDSTVDAQPLILAAAKTFRSVRSWPTSRCPYGNQWPMPQNWAWQIAAKAIEAGKMGTVPHWLWWEVDARPMKAGWLDALEAAHQEGDKPFSGCMTSNPNGRYMAGVGIYPGRTSLFCQNALRVRNHPFDVVAGVVDNILRYVTPIGHLIYHQPPAERNLKPSPPDTAVLVHPVKVNNPIEPEHSPKTPTRSKKISKRKRAKIQVQSSPITTVITNCDRPEMLWQCYRSCVAAGIQNIVVSSAKTTKAIRDVHRKMKDAKIVAFKDDPGCNATWLAGVKAVKTPFVHILHDDDIVLPEFRSVEMDLNKADFCLWGGLSFGSTTKGGKAGGVHQLAPWMEDGVHSSTLLLERLLGMQLSISPVAGVLPTEHAIDVLKEFKNNCNGPEFRYKPTMEVGNDLLLWLRAVDRFKSFHYSTTPLTAYGHHDESATCRDTYEYENKLLPIYSRLRQYWLSQHPRILHVVPRYEPGDSEAARRIAFASATWNYLYASGMVVPIHVPWFSRTSRVIGDVSGLPFVHDVLNHGLRCCSNADDIVMVTNDDTCLHPQTPWVLLDFMRDKQACCAFRVGVDKDKMQIATKTRNPMAHSNEPEDPGRDLFAFKSMWLMQHLHKLPDYLIGRPDWDSTLGVLIRMAAGNIPTKDDWAKPHADFELPRGYVYHENHDAAWRADQNIRVRFGCEYNRALTKQWASENKIGFQPWMT